METQVIVALSAGAGGLLAVVGFLFKEKVLTPPPPRGGMNGSSKPLVVEARLSQETEARMVQTLERLTALYTAIVSAIEANNAAHGDTSRALVALLERSAPRRE